MFQKILLCTDFSPLAQSAQAAAAWYCARFGATLHVLHVDEEFEPGLHDPEELIHFLRDVESHRTERMERIRDELAAQVGPVTIERRRGVPWQEVLGCARDIGAHLLVMGTHGHEGVKRVLLGSTSLRVLRRSNVPVLTLNDDAARFATAGVHKMLFPTDFSDASTEALPFAAGLAEKLGARLDLLHVLRLPAFVPAVPGEPPIVLPPQVQTGREEQYRRKMEKLCSDITAIDMSYNIRIGANPAEVIADYAQRNAVELVLMPSRGHGALHNILFGSTAEATVRISPAPVLTLHSKQIPG